MTESSKDQAYIGLAAEIVAAYVSNNAVPAAELPTLIGTVYGSLSTLGGKPEEVVKAALNPPVPIKKSITDDYLICLEDGKRFKSLKRHLHAVYGLSPDQYRQKWGLPHDYPMVAPAYAKARSALAKDMGLGASRRRPVSEADQTASGLVDDPPSTDMSLHEPAASEPELPPKKPGRRKKASADSA